MGQTFSQFFWIPTPPITERNCPDQKDRVFIVTGGYTGIGFELCKILYARNATVYIAGRSQEKATAAIAELKKASPESIGRLESLLVDLADLSSVKRAATTFKGNESRLDGLINNAGIMLKGANDPDQNDLHLRTNCLGPCLLYKLLLSVLSQTASSATTGSVRVLWIGSIAIEVNAPQPAGMVLDDAGKPQGNDELTSYGSSKVGNVFLARKYARDDTPRTGVVHACLNPGNLRTGLQRHWEGLDITLMKKLLFYPTEYGAYTNLWALLAPELTPARSGAYVFPWGRFGEVPAGLESSMKDAASGGAGVAARFTDWCEKEIQPYT